MSREPRIEVTDLGTWGPVELLAEYDGADDTIRVNRRAVEHVRAVAGAAEAARFVACAVAHERCHRADPSAGEQAVRERAAAECGLELERVNILFGLGRRPIAGDP